MIRKLSATSRAGTIREHNNQGKTVQHAECESGSFCCTLEHGKNKERDRDPQNWVGALPAKLFSNKTYVFQCTKKRWGNDFVSPKVYTGKPFSHATDTKKPGLTRLCMAFDQTPSKLHFPLPCRIAQPLQSVVGGSYCCL